MAAFLPRAVNKQRCAPPPCKKPRHQNNKDDVVTESSSFSYSAESVHKVEQTDNSIKDSAEPGGHLSDVHSDGIDEDSDSDEPVVSFSKDQRAPEPGEPTCVVCGRYGAYVCDLTDDDVCSLECKAKVLRDTGHDAIGVTDGHAPTDALPGTSQTEGVSDLSSPAAMSPAQADLLRSEMKIKVSDEDAPLPMVDFEAFIGDHSEQLLVNLADVLAITVPTPIQMQAIPCVYSQRDVLICANTGSGKTVAFLLPVIKMIHACQLVRPAVLILAPVRELCMQIEDVAKSLMRGIPNMRTALVVGGLPIANQVHRLQQQVQVIIATPARLLDVIRNHGSALDLSSIRTLILDEADSLLDLGFEQQLNEVLESVPAKRQTLLSSATLPPRIQELASRILSQPITVTAGEPTLPAEGIRHVVLWESENLKKKRLFTVLSDEKLFNPPVLVFVTSRVATLLLAEAIDKTLDVPCMAVHGDMTQEKRQKILKDFKDGKYSVLVATGGLVGRGLDLPMCKQVVVFDFPSSVHEYIHQVGRCARLGSTGTAITFINDSNKRSFLKLFKLLERTGTRLPSEFTHSPHLHSQVERQKQRSAPAHSRPASNLTRNRNSLMNLMKSHQKRGWHA